MRILALGGGGTHFRGSSLASGSQSPICKSLGTRSEIKSFWPANNHRRSYEDAVTYTSSS